MSEAQKVTLAKHVNQKSAGVDPSDAAFKKDKTVDPIYMGRFMGVIEGVKVFEDRQGKEKTVFTGDFVCRKPNGDLITADKMYQFGALEEKLVGAFNSGDKKALEFSYDVFSIPEEKAARGYAYQAKSVIATATNDRLASLMEKVNAVALPTAPKQATEEPAKDDKKKK